MTIKDATDFLHDYQPKIYLLHLIVGKDQDHLTFAFNTQVERVNFEQFFTNRYDGIIHLMSRSEPLLNPEVLKTIESLNSKL